MTLSSKKRSEGEPVVSDVLQDKLATLASSSDISTTHGHGCREKLKFLHNTHLQKLSVVLYKMLYFLLSTSLVVALYLLTAFLYT